MQRSIFRWEREFSSQLVRLAIPIALQSVVASSMQLVDNLMIAAIGSDLPIAAVSQANRVSFLFQVALFGAISGSSIFVAQYWGKRDVLGVRRTFGIATVVGLVIAALIGLPSIAAPRAIMRLLVKSEDVVNLGAEYLGIMGFVYFVQSQSLVRAAVLKSTEQVKLPMFASIAGILTNVVFNYLLIFDHMWIGGWGVRGAAIATLIGTLVELFIIEFFARRYRFSTAAKFREMLPTAPQVKHFLAIALPVLLNESLWAAGTVTYSAVYGRIGDGVAASAAAGIFSNVDQLSGIAIRALCHASGVMVGMALGAGQLERAKLYAKRFMFASPLITQAFCVAVVLPLSGLIVGFFPVDAGTARMAREMTYILIAFSWVHAINCTVIVSLLRTGGDVRAAAVIDVAPLWAIGVPLAAIAGIVLKWELKYVYLSTYLEALAKLAFGIRRYRQRKWVRSIVK